MATCEKCWRDAEELNVDLPLVERYDSLVRGRDAQGRSCTPEEQRGGRKEPRSSAIISKGHGEPPNEFFSMFRYLQSRLFLPDSTTAIEFTERDFTEFLEKYGFRSRGDGPP